MAICPAIALVMSLYLSGCPESQEAYVLNPDGAGKVYYDARFSFDESSYRVRIAPWVFTAPPIKLDSSSQADLAEALPDGPTRRAILAVIERSVGVEAWRDVRATRIGQDRYHFRGTAYFRDLDELILSDGLSQNRLLTPSLTPSPEGRLTLRIDPSPKAVEPTETVQVTRQELETRVDRVRDRMENNYRIHSRNASRVEITQLYRLPGPTLRSNLIADSNGELVVRYDGARLLKIWQHLITDEAWIAEQISNGRDPTKNGDIFSNPANAKAMFGTTLPLEAVIAPDGPLFDYDAEVAEARRTQAALLEDLRLGFEAERAHLPHLTNLRVAGLRVIFESLDEEQLEPFGQFNKRSFSLVLIGDLPEPAFYAKVDDVGIALTENGLDLRSSTPRWRPDRSRLGSIDRRNVMLRFDFSLPTPTPYEIERLSGRLTYRVSAGTRTLRYSLEDLTDDTIDKDYIEAFKIVESPDRGGIKIETVLQVKHYEIKSFTFVDPEGQAIKLRREGRRSSDSTTYWHRSKEPLPKSAELVIEIYDAVEERQALFEIEHIPLPTF